LETTHLKLGPAYRMRCTLDFKHAAALKSIMHLDLRHIYVIDIAGI